MKRFSLLTGLAASAVLAGISSIAPAQTLDGSIAGDPYTLLSVQTVNTQFGDNFSELNAAWGTVSGGVLYLALTGNLESNFNKLNIFIDSVPGGENTLTNNVDFGGNNPTNDGWAGKYAGFTFDAGFAADYMIIARNGSSGGDRFDLDFTTVGSTSVVQTSGDIFGGTLEGVNASVGASGIGVAFNNSNVAGIGGGDGGADPVAAAAVQTGLELAIPLSAIGNPGIGDIILISAHINGSNHDYLSNQSLGGYLPPQGNLGGDGIGGYNGTVGQLNMNDFAGLQYFAIVVPEPTSLAMLGLVGLAVLRRPQRNWNSPARSR
jgi:hypothetical protein